MSPIDLSCFLKKLIEADGSVVRHDELYVAIWKDRVVERTNGLHQLAKDVRQALTDRATTDYVQNVPGVGYRFCGDLSVTPMEIAPFRFSARTAYVSGLATLPTMLIVYCVLIANGVLS